MPDHQSSECRLDRPTAPPTETVLCLRRKAAECTQGQNLVFQKHLHIRRQRPACECCCRNQRQLRHHVSNSTSPQRASPSLSSIFPRTTSGPSRATLLLPQDSTRRVRNHLADRAHSFDQSLHQRATHDEQSQAKLPHSCRLARLKQRGSA